MLLHGLIIFYVFHLVCHVNASYWLQLLYIGETRWCCFWFEDQRVEACWLSEMFHFNNLANTEKAFFFIFSFVIF